jgi:hypothetical protein
MNHHPWGLLQQNLHQTNPKAFHFQEGIFYSKEVLFNINDSTSGFPQLFQVNSHVVVDHILGFIA